MISVSSEFANRPNRISPLPVSVMPTAIAGRGPKRSIAQPTKNARKLFSSRATDVASDVAAWLNPSAWEIGTKKIVAA